MFGRQDRKDSEFLKKERIARGCQHRNLPDVPCFPVSASAAAGVDTTRGPIVMEPVAYEVGKSEAGGGIFTG